MTEKPTQSAAYVVKCTKSQRETKQPYDPNNIDHCWAKAIHDEMGPKALSMSDRGTTYQYFPSDGGEA